MNIFITVKVDLFFYTERLSVTLLNMKFLPFEAIQMPNKSGALWTFFLLVVRKLIDIFHFSTSVYCYRPFSQSYFPENK
jgi:hypothetical protein